MKKIDINIEQINILSKHNIIGKIKKWDTTNWKHDIQTKSTLYIYNLYKREISEENWVDNTLGSKLILRGRTNTLTLNWRNRFQNKSEQCPCCDCETETLERFLLDCEEYNDIRQNQTFLDIVTATAGFGASIHERKHLLIPYEELTIVY